MKSSKLLFLFTTTLLLSSQSFADSAVIDLSSSPYPYTTGKDIFHHVCAACHMQDAKGATGAGHFPALAGNHKLVTPEYMKFVVMNGQKGMPPFRDQLTNKQIAETINYVRSNFGNHYTDKVTADDVAKFR